VVESGELTIDGEYIPERTEVGVAGWTVIYREESFGDPWIFRPERWIVDPNRGVISEDVLRASAAFNPFSIGEGTCAGQKLSMIRLQITIAGTLYRMDFRRLHGDTLGGGASEIGWGMRSPDRFQIQDAYVSQRTGPSFSSENG
jgi:cytochrome P450